MDLSAFSFAPETPEISEYCQLRIAAGMSPKTAAAAAIGLPNTLFAVTVRLEGELIGMGRIIGDGGLFFQVTDMAVHPDHQARGLGKAIFAQLLDYLKREAPLSAFVSLIADGDARHLYAKFGFTPTMPASIGMGLRITEQFKQ